ncbi:GntR family transcriptional regulator [Pseudomonas sp. REB1044]
MELHIHLIGGKGLTDQLHQQLHEAIARGHLAVGTQLPPTRLLAEQVAFARGALHSRRRPGVQRCSAGAGPGSRRVALTQLTVAGCALETLRRMALA